MYGQIFYNLYVRYCSRGSRYSAHGENDKYSIASAFVFYFTLPFIILNTELFHVVWWIKGGLIGGILALPMIIIVSKEDKKSGLPMLIMSTMLGEVIAILAHLFSL